MVFYSVLVISFFIIALIIKEKRIVFYTLAEDSVALVNELLADIDEEEKIKTVQKNTNKLAFSLIKLLLIFLLAFIAGSIPIIIYCLVSDTSYSSLNFTSLFSIIAISLGATIPFILPKRNKPVSEYSELSQLLHRMALNNYTIGNKLFKKETKILRKKNLVNRNDFLIISGLARAGTTSLMNNISQIKDFKTLNYANMPFLMCPNTWRNFYKPKDQELKERSHKDGIMIGLNSNEALEEYFFKLKANDSYIRENCLTEYNISKEVFDDYLNYQSIIKLDNQKIYLAKNNNFILRYKSMRTLNDDFLMVILYRDPLTHAASLMEKHKEYTKLQEEDPFILEYMNWLGHHEFGQQQKPFCFNGSNKVAGDKGSLDYWLNIWNNYYNYVLTIDHPNTFLINYETFCNQPNEVIASITEKLNILSPIPEFKSFSNKRKNLLGFSQEIYEKASAIFIQLNKKQSPVIY